MPPLQLAQEYCPQVSRHADSQVLQVLQPDGLDCEYQPALMPSM